MGFVTGIEWTDHTFNPWRGCTEVHAGCRHCYARTLVQDRFGQAEWGAGGTRAVASAGSWREPLKWDRRARALNRRARVFCASLADVFEDFAGPTTNHLGQRRFTHDADGRQATAETIADVRRRLFELIDRTPHLDWLLLTKRPENIRRMTPAFFPGGYTAEAGAMNQEGPRPNVWLGTSISVQAHADRQIPELLKTRDLCVGLFLSCEPLLGPIEFSDVTQRADAVQQLGKRALSGIDWVIVGGESGAESRPMHPAWARSIRGQCQGAGVPFFFKQWGDWQPAGEGPARDLPAIRIDSQGRDVGTLPGLWDNCCDAFLYRVGKREAGAQLGNREWRETPWDSAT